MARLFHFRSFWNFLGRNKLFTATNIFGFAVSQMFVLLLELYVQDELSVDSFHENKERIYRLEADDGAQFAPGLAPAMAARYPEIEAWTRICTKDRYTLDDNADILIYFQGRRNADLSARLDTAELNRCFKQTLRLRRFVENISGNPYLN